MGDQGFLLGKLKLERITQEVSQACFDLLRFRFRASKAKERVISIANVFESPELRIVRISSGVSTKLSFDLVSLCVCSLLFKRGNSVLDTVVCGINVSAFSLRIRGEQFLLNVAIQSV